MEQCFLVSAGEMKQYDRYTTDCLGIPALVLMERAALATVQAMREELGDLSGKRILAVCGGGNNGGDGAAVSRLLLDAGSLVEVCCIAEEETCSPETKRQLQILREYGKEIFPIFPAGEYDIIIDALFGVGLSRDVGGVYAEWIEKINRCGAYVVSVDIPSGIHADSGRTMGCSVNADLTVTYAFMKRGLFLYPGRTHAGKTVCKDIGITDRSFAGCPPACFTYTGRGDASLFPVRTPEGNKGTFGKLLIAAGSVGMGGACLLCAESAYRAGAGMVKAVTPQDNRTILQTALPEALLLTYEENNVSSDKIREAWEWSDGIVAGPGMGMGEDARTILRMLLEEADRSVILDADALNLLSAEPALWELASKRAEVFPDKTLILTPHQKELARLTGKTIWELKREPLKYANELADKVHCVVVSKDAVTAVCTGKEPFFLNTAGNSGMATAGSGDVLAGILGGFLVQSQMAGENPVKWVSKGVYLHACAGDRARERVGESAMLAGDLIKGLTDLSGKGICGNE